MQALAGGITQFEGVLIRTHHKPGQKHAQLVFKAAEGQTRLSLTRDIRMAQSLAIGRTYQVRGEEFSASGKSFIGNPSITLMQPKAATPPKRRMNPFVAVALLTLVSITSGAAAAINHPTANDYRFDSKSSSPQQLNEEPLSTPAKTPSSPLKSRPSEPAATKPKPPAEAAAQPKREPSPRSAPAPSQPAQVNAPTPVPATRTEITKPDERASGEGNNKTQDDSSKETEGGSEGSANQGTEPNTGSTSSPEIGRAHV